MKKFFIIFASMLFLTSCSFKANENSTSDTKQEEISMSQDISLEENKKIGQKNLSDSPRHQQWVEIDNNGKIIYAYVVYPENKQSSSAVVLIHENKGLNDWARSMADQIAAE
jgi:carboxymethylenebutenolidase